MIQYTKTNLITTVVYVCRNPKDTVVSFYKMTQLFSPQMQELPFLDYARWFKHGETAYGNYWNHLKVFF